MFTMQELASYVAHAVPSFDERRGEMEPPVHFYEDDGTNGGPSRCAVWLQTTKDQDAQHYMLLEDAIAWLAEAISESAHHKLITVRVLSDDIEPVRPDIDDKLRVRLVDIESINEFS